MSADELNRLTCTDSERERIRIGYETAKLIRWIGGAIFVALLGIGTTSISLLANTYVEQQKTAISINKLASDFAVVQERTNMMWYSGNWSKIQ